LLNMRMEGTSKSLLDTLAQLYEQGHRTVRIGCSRGSSFVYIGPITDIDFKNINKRSHKRAQDMLLNAKSNLAEAESALFAARKESGLNKAADKVESLRKKVALEQDRLNAWKKYQDRGVLKVYPSTIDDDMIVIVDGYDGSVQYLFKERDGPMPDECVQNLVDQIYEGMTDELITAYQALINLPEGERKRGTVNRIRALENTIRKDPYGLLGDPEGIIKACRKRAMNERRIKRQP